MIPAANAEPATDTVTSTQNATGLTADPAIPMDAIVSPALAPLKGIVTAQPSKNYTTRYLLAAALADGESIVRNCATSDDARAMQRSLRAMGATVEIVRSSNGGLGEDVRIVGFGNHPELATPGPINVGNAGAVLRLLLGVGALLPKVTFVTSHPESLGKRPNADLLVALEQAGCTHESREGMLPITLHGGSLRGGKIEVSGARSSQFLSSLLFLAPLLPEPVTIKVTGGLVSRAPVRQTIEVMRRAGVKIDADESLLSFSVAPQRYMPGEYFVNGDWPGSAALLSAAAVAGGDIRVCGLYEDEQGEKAACTVIGDMLKAADSAQDCFHYFSAGEWQEGARVVSKGLLKCIDFDGDIATDAILALLAPACFALGTSRFHNVANLRIKECDRISEPLVELRKLGVDCWEGHESIPPDSDRDAILIKGDSRHCDGGITVDGRGDHRVIMLLSVVALRCKNPVRISGAHHVAKSYPAFFEHLAALGANVTLERRSV